MSSEQGGVLDQLPLRADRSDLRRILFSNHDRVRANVNEQLSTEVSGLIDRLTWAYGILRRVESNAPSTERSAHALTFLWVSFKSLFDSTYLLISGMPTPAGNLMRHFSEALIMAMLTSHPGIDLLDVYLRDMIGFRIKRAHQYMRKKEILDLLDVDPESWRAFMKATAWHHQHSHVSALTTADLFMLREGGGIKLLGEFDEYRQEAYRKDLLLRSSAAERLGELAQSVGRRLVTLQRDPSDK